MLSKEEQRDPSFCNSDQPDDGDDDAGDPGYFEDNVDDDGEDGGDSRSSSRKRKAPSTRSVVLPQRCIILAPNQKGLTRIRLSSLGENQWTADGICEWDCITNSRQRVL